MLAWCYEQGVGTEKDIPRAVELWKKASEHGVEEAKRRC
jgi:TPR repeat protein